MIGIQDKYINNKYSNPLNNITIITINPTKEQKDIYNNCSLVGGMMD